ncbi:MAG: YbaB/EbfC family nucleoid-associated protein [Alphaproteobacteria bacterium]|nr:YbaB/EbfC family nucleoid-associated protein [Alphaproteobacteria bacterium SS10]
MKNLQQMMKQAQEAQTKIAAIQAEIEAMEITGEAGGGAVKVVMTGKGMARSVEIDKSMIDPEDKEMLEDLLVAAINQARTKAEEETQQRMASFAQSMGLPPGMNLPF